MSAELRRLAGGVSLMLFDVDGILTDGTLYLSDSGEPVKAFNAHDGHGIKMLLDAGIEAGFMSSRSSATVQRRARELGVTLLLQGVADKGAALTGLLAERGIRADAAGFMGDDYIDLPAMMRCGFSATVPAAPEAVRSRARYVTRAAGGRGAVREVCELILASGGRLEAAIARYLA